MEHTEKVTWVISLKCNNKQPTRMRLQLNERANVSMCHAGTVLAAAVKL